MERTVTVAAVQAKYQWIESEDEFRERIMSLTKLAADKGAKIVVLPEDIGLWLEFARKSPRVLAFHMLSSALSVPVLHMHGVAAELLSPTGAPAAKPGRPSLRTQVDGIVNWISAHVRIPLFGEWLAQSRIDQIYKSGLSAAARTFDVTIVGGSVCEVVDGKVMNCCYVFDVDGAIAGVYYKHHLINFEMAYGCVPSAAPIHAIDTRNGRIGACICYDLNFGPGDADPVVAALRNDGAQIICAGSTGIRITPNAEVDPATDLPQIDRCRESGLPIVRAYQCGTMLGGIYMDGLSTIVTPADGGPDVVDTIKPDRRQEECVIEKVVTLR